MFFFTVLVVKLVISGISFLVSFILALRVVLVAKLVISGIQVFYLQYFLSWHHLHLSLTASFFTKKLSLLKSKGTGSNLSTSNLSTLLFKLLKLIGAFFNLSISNLSASDFELAKYKRKIQF